MERETFQTENALERIRIEIVSDLNADRIEIVSDLNADAALTLRKKRGFSVCSVAGSRSRDYQSNGVSNRQRDKAGRLTRLSRNKKIYN